MWQPTDMGGVGGGSCSAVVPNVFCSGGSFAVDRTVCGCYIASQGPRSLQQQQHSSEESDSDEGGGKLGRLQQPAAAEAKHGSKQGSKVLDRNKLLQVPVENLSKWQRKRLREKAKKQQQQQLQ